MKKSGQLTAFYVEMLLMTVAVTVMVLLLTRFFALGRSTGSLAQSLTGAVSLAENAAEAFSAAGSPEELRELLDENGNAVLVEGSSLPAVRAAYTPDRQPDPSGPLVLLVTWAEEPSEKGILASGVITVTSDDGATELYALETAVYIPEVAE